MKKKLRTVKIEFSIETTPHLSTNIIWRSNNPSAVTEGTDKVQFQVQYLLCYIQTKSVYIFFFLGGGVKHALSDVVYIDMTVLKEEGPNDIFLQQDRGPPNFHTTVQTSWHRQPSHLGTSLT